MGRQRLACVTGPMQHPSLEGIAVFTVPDEPANVKADVVIMSEPLAREDAPRIRTRPRSTGDMARNWPDVYTEEQEGGRP